MSGSFVPDIAMLYCGCSLAQGDYLPEGTINGGTYKARFIMIPCGYKIEVVYLIKLIEQGMDGVVMVVCPQEKCRSLTGSARTKNRVRYARRLLEEVGEHGERLGIVEGYRLSADEIKAFAGERADIIREVGENPLKSNGV